jgi:hypothetical protein
MQFWHSLSLERVSWTAAHYHVRQYYAWLITHAKPSICEIAYKFVKTDFR